MNAVANDRDEERERRNREALPRCVRKWVGVVHSLENGVPYALTNGVAQCSLCFAHRDVGAIACFECCLYRPDYAAALPPVKTFCHPYWHLLHYLYGRDTGDGGLWLRDKDFPCGGRTLLRSPAVDRVYLDLARKMLATIEREHRRHQAAATIRRLKASYRQYYRKEWHDNG